LNIHCGQPIQAFTFDQPRVICHLGLCIHPATPKRQVTGIARMDTFRQSGESLAGRFFGLRLYPLSLASMAQEFLNALAAWGHGLKNGGSCN
jgi:hypothetical protein